jgi:hypothetical protein
MLLIGADGRLTGAVGPVIAMNRESSIGFRGRRDPVLTREGGKRLLNSRR